MDERSPAAHPVGMDRVRVLIVDDDERFRALARRMVNAAGYDVVGTAANGAAAITALATLRPDAVLLDVQLPDASGIAIARQISDADGDVRVVLTSTDSTLVDDAVLAGSGAAAFVPKDQLAVSVLRSLIEP
jgi:DNA-binding NarL/FixJ family response regulator